MKTIMSLFVIFIFMLTLVSCQKQDEEKAAAENELSKSEAQIGDEESEEAEEMISVPTEVAHAFQEKFSTATDLEWGMESDTEYEAEFIMNGIAMSANFDGTGKWLETEAVLNKDQLPTSVIKTLQSEFANYQVSNVESVEKSGEPTLYEVKMEMGETITEVVIDAQGKIIEKDSWQEEEQEETEQDED